MRRFINSFYPCDLIVHSRLHNGPLPVSANPTLLYGWEDRIGDIRNMRCAIKSHDIYDIYVPLVTKGLKMKKTKDE